MTTGIIFDIKRFAIHDGPGLRTTVFFKGCSLDCWACHNPEGKSQGLDLLVRGKRCNLCRDCIEVCGPGALSLHGNSIMVDRKKCDLCGACVTSCLAGALEIAGKEVTVDRLMREIEKDTVFYDQSGGGATFSGGEPLCQPDFLLEMLRQCRNKEISTVVDTAGYAPLPVVQSVAEHTDLFLYDLKLIDDRRHKAFTGASNDSILENLFWLSDNGSSIIVRFPLLPGVNDDKKDLRALGTFVASLPNQHTVDVLPYHRAGIDKYARLGHTYRLSDARPPSQEATSTVARTLADCGVKVTVRGEAHDFE